MEAVNESGNGEASISARVRQARSKFLSMAGAYSLGAMNDNFFKQAASLMAVAAGSAHYQGYATIVFTIPFMLFAAPAGWLADRFSKRDVVIGAKGLEVLAMSAGAVGIYFTYWPLIFIMLFIMALQSTIFSPALNGSIPELYPEEFVTTANGRVRMVVTLSILLGIALAGKCLAIKGQWVAGVPKGQAVVAAAVLLMSLTGLMISLGVKRIPAAGTQETFPWMGPVETIRHLWNLLQDGFLSMAIWGNCLFWFLASLQVQLINVLGQKQLGLDKDATSYMLVAQMIGIGSGALMAGKLATGARWTRVLIPSAVGMGLPMTALAALPLLLSSVQIPLAFLLLALVGVAGGIFMVPLEAFIQIRPSSTQKGKVWASANFAAFAGIACSGLAFNTLNEFFIPTTSFGVASLSAYIVAGVLVVILPKVVHKPPPESGV